MGRQLGPLNKRQWQGVSPLSIGTQKRTASGVTREDSRQKEDQCMRNLLGMAVVVETEKQIENILSFRVVCRVDFRPVGLSSQ